MAGMGKVAGIILLSLGLAVGLVAALWLVSGVAEGKLAPSGFALGLAVVVIFLVAPFLGAGSFLLVRGRAEEREFAEVEKEQRLLDMVQSRGRLRISDVALEMNLTRDQVRDYIYDLVGKGLFTGFIDWREGLLYAREAAEMRTTKCPNCGGERELVGKGVVRCPYCGVELFI